MRTTVTLDDDVVNSLKTDAYERDVSFKQALNEAVRAGLQGSPNSSDRFVMKTSAMGARPEYNLDKALQLLGEMDDEEFIRKRDLGK